MRILVEDWSLRLPVASAVLTVLYPEEFTVYDRRVVDEIEPDRKGQLHRVADWTNFERIWPAYKEFIGAVKSAVPEVDSLRDKDRELWGRSFFQAIKK